MRRLAALTIGILLCVTAVRAEISSSQAKRLNDAASVLSELRAIPDKGIPGVPGTARSA